MDINIGEKAFIERQIQKMKNDNTFSTSYTALYSNYEENLAKAFSSYHNRLNRIFEYMNSQLVNRHKKYFHADPSRTFIDISGEVNSFVSNLDRLNLKLDKYYNERINEIGKFISKSGGTEVPDKFEKISIVETEPIFLVNNVKIRQNFSFSLKLVGGGSYAKVYKYYDSYYDKTIALKKSNVNLTEKEYERFKIEFDTMKGINSPYIVDVYKFDKEEREYTMEFMDSTLLEFIEKNNKNLGFEERFFLINQIIRLFEYLESKKIFHRDISYKNVLIKNYDDGRIIKLSDFGLVKLPDSTLTSEGSEIRGSLNDYDDLNIIGFDKYDIVHETYALTKLITFILSGKIYFSNIKEPKIIEFLKRGTGPKENRFQNISELKEEIRVLRKKIID